MIKITYTENELSKVAGQLLDSFSGTDIWLLNGEMGAGKTTLIKALCRHLGIVDEMSSPTFSIVNEYQNESEEVFYHFDFYRLEEIEEAINIGVEDYFYSGNMCFIEWADMIRELLPDNYVEININLVDHNKRHLIATMHE